MKFIQIDHNILEKIPKIGCTAFSVYSILKKHADYKSQEAYPSMETIAKLLGISERSVVRSINKLLEHGIIQKKKTKTYNVYTLKLQSDNMSVCDIATDKIAVSNLQTDKNDITDCQIVTQKLTKTTPESDKLSDKQEPRTISNKRQPNNENQVFGGFLSEERKEELKQKWERWNIDIVVFENISIPEKIWLIATSLSIDTEKFPPTFDFDTVDNPDMLIYYWSQKIQEKSEQTRQNTIKAPAKWLQKAINGNWDIPNVYKEEFDKIKIRINSKKERHHYQKALRILSNEFSHDSAIKLLNAWHDHYRYHEDAKKHIAKLVYSGEYKNGLDTLWPPKKEETIKTKKSLLDTYKEHFYSNADEIEPLEVSK